MIDTATLQDWSALGAFAIIFGTAVAVCAYSIGRQHSYWHGYYAGTEKARQQFIPRLMRAKVNAQRAGRILGMREAIQLTLGHAPAGTASPARTARPAGHGVAPRSRAGTTSVAATNPPRIETPSSP